MDVIQKMACIIPDLIAVHNYNFFFTLPTMSLTCFALLCGGQVIKKERKERFDFVY